MSSAMLHGLGDCTPELNCGCLEGENKPKLPTLEDPAVSVEEIAKIFAVTNYTVRSWFKVGKLPGFKIPGNQWRALQSDVTAFAQKLYGEN